jgi:UDP-N-acetylmuramate dehydrogenase
MTRTNALCDCGPALLREGLRVGEPLSLHTTLRVGGKADYFYAPRTLEGLAETVSRCREGGVRFIVIGSGSNVLFSDRGFCGAVITTRRIRGIEDCDGLLEVAAGESLAAVVEHAERRGIRSLSFLSGIPGSVGGAVAMNAGIRGRAIGDRVRSVQVLDQEGRTRVLSPEECRFEYRSSEILKRRLVVLSATLSLSGEAYDRSELLRRRRQTQPVSLPSAGCVFKNPSGVSAGELIDRSGMKGFRIGCAGVSERHANFIVNLGGATSAEICKLIDIVRQKVYNTSHVSLDLEIEVIDG